MTHSSNDRSRKDSPVDLSRRRFLAQSAGWAATLGLLPGAIDRPGVLWRPSAAQAREAPAQSLIQILLVGGLSHIDSFDPKPLAPVEVRGDWKAIPTTIDGVQLSEHMTKTAAVAKKVAFLRAMTHGEAAHERGIHSMLTGYPPSPAIIYPSAGAVLSHELEKLTALPIYIAVPSADEEFLGTGYLPSKFAPFSVGGDPRSGDFRVRDLDRPAGISPERDERRRRLLRKVEGDVAKEDAADAVRAMEAFYDQAYALIDAPAARTAFEIKKEPQKMRDRYGMTGIGQRLLLARRLVAAGARCVTVIDRGYDHHESIYSNLKERLVDLDRGYAALIDDLDEQGLLGRTIVTMTSEFGRTPRLNGTGGRDHWPKVFTALVAGGGLKGGRAIGESDAFGAEPAERAVTPADLFATVYAQMGIDPKKRLVADGGRPIDLVRDGTRIRELVG